MKDGASDPLTSRPKDRASNTAAPRSKGRAPDTRTADDRRSELIAAARELYETKGLSHTTVKDITNYVGVTRSLFYRYFEDKDDITSRVLEAYVDEFLEGWQYWNAQRERGNVEKALEDILRYFRNAILTRDSFRRSLASYENAALYLQFTNLVADHIARYIVDSTVKEYSQYHTIESDHVYETFYTLIIGLIMLIRTHPDISDKTLKCLAAQCLHLNIKS
jgi:AcrR family transcriptional regulator